MPSLCPGLPRSEALHYIRELAPQARFGAEKTSLLLILLGSPAEAGFRQGRRSFACGLSLRRPRRPKGAHRGPLPPEPARGASAMGGAFLFFDAPESCDAPGAFFPAGRAPGRSGQALSRRASANEPTGAASAPCLCAPDPDFSGPPEPAPVLSENPRPAGRGLSRSEA